MEPRYVDVNEDGQDAEEMRSAAVPGWARPKTPLQKRALLATGHRNRVGEAGLFPYRDLANRFRAVEEKARGATQEEIMMQEWMLHCIGYCEEKNKTQIVRSLKILVAMIENEDKRIVWIAANRERVLAARGDALKSRFISED